MYFPFKLQITWELKQNTCEPCYASPPHKYIRLCCIYSCKFNYVSFNGSMTPCGSNVYTNPNMEIISPSRNILVLGIYMSGDRTFNYHISSLSKKCANLSGWILRPFNCAITVRLHLSVMVVISDQTYNSTREYTTVIYRDE